jgi:hypothetical protein
MNRCQNWAICPLGDLAVRIGCRKPGCPERTAADVASPLNIDEVMKCKK